MPTFGCIYTPPGMAQQFRAVPINAAVPQPVQGRAKQKLPTPGNLGQWAYELQTKARAEYTENEFDQLIQSYPSDELGVQIFNLAGRAVGRFVEDHELYIDIMKTPSEGKTFVEYAKETGAPYYYDYQSSWLKWVTKLDDKPDDLYPYVKQPDFYQAKSLEGGPPNTHCAGFYHKNDVSRADANSPPDEGRWMSYRKDKENRRILTDSQEPDGPFRVTFAVNNVRFYVLMESDGDKKNIGTSQAQDMEYYEWAHASKLMQSIDMNNSTPGQHHNDAFFVRMNVTAGKMDRTVGGGTPALRQARQYINHIRQLFYGSVDVWVKIIKRICERLHNPNLQRYAHTFWINFCFPQAHGGLRHIELRSWIDVLNETNHATPDDIAVKTTFFGALRNHSPKVEITEYKNDRNPGGGAADNAHKRLTCSIWIATIKLPSTIQIQGVFDFHRKDELDTTQAMREAEKYHNLIWCVPDLYKLIGNKQNKTIHRQYLNWEVGDPAIDNKRLQPRQDVVTDTDPKFPTINYRNRYSKQDGILQHVYFDFAVFRFLELVIHMQQYQLAKMWREFNYEPQGEGQREWKKLTDMRKFYTDIVTNNPRALVNRANVQIKDTDYPDMLPWRRESTNLGAMLFRSAHKTMPGLDPRLQQYIAKHKMVGAAVLLRAMRCTNLAVLQETARQYRQGDESLKKKIEALLRQFPVCSESELRWLFQQILAQPITLL